MISRSGQCPLFPAATVYQIAASRTRRGTRLGALQEPCHLGCGQQGVMLGLEGRQLLPAHVGAASGHHHGRVPAQQRERAAEGVQAMKFLLELFVG